ncbi:MAG: DNA phosphorothioation system sulfurtransferase DndC [Acidobacteriota bacterium]
MTRKHTDQDQPIGIGKAQSSVFDSRSIDDIYDEIIGLYKADHRPWVVGFSGGKDSTATLQLVWEALVRLPEEDRTKPVHVISSDTLVESPVITAYIGGILDKINVAGKEQTMPFTAQIVVPKLQDTFWVNMIGRGYPAPYRRFRWCTDRLKIQPANRFIEEHVDHHGEVILVLGVRRAESATRAQVMSLHRKPGDLISRHSTLRSAWVYAPIEFFSTDDVWSYLLSVKSPWGADNRQLLTLYRNAQAGECPLVVDTTTPSCGNSRFGCWTCTVVERDKSMEAMIDSGDEWMEPLLELRDWLANTRVPESKHEYREVRRRNGRIQQWGEKQDRIVWGPYKLDVRREILRRVLEAQETVRKTGPDPHIELISHEQLHEIRRIWRVDEGDWEDSIPRIHRAVTGRDLDWVQEDAAAASELDERVLLDVSREHEVPSGLMRELMDLQRELQGLGRRHGVQNRIDRILAKDWRDPQQVLDAIGWTPSGTDDEVAVEDLADDD